MQMTNLSEASQLFTVIPGEAGVTNVKHPLVIELGEPHPDNRSMPARPGLPAPVLDLDAWCAAHKSQLGDLADPKKLVAHLNKSRVFRLAVEGKRDESGAIVLAPEIAIG